MDGCRDARAGYDDAREDRELQLLCGRLDKHWSGYNPNDWVNGGSRPYYDAMLSTGLRRYGFTTDADAILARWTTNQLAKGTTPESINPDVGGGGYSRYLLTGNCLMEAYLAKISPTLLQGVGTSAITS
jgi:hypothetical protein